MKKINEDLYVGGQILPSDVKDLESLGIKSIVCNRPDNESDNQPNFSEIDEEAKKLSIKTDYIPYSPRQMSEEDVKKFAKALQELPKPIYAFCLGGVRSELIAASAYNILDE
tara:strand:- start:152 stop:487 length:336 start_codon:yes stop_codon:yes gene_type:complete